MTSEKQTKADPAKADPASKYTVGDAPIYIGSDRYDAGTEVLLTDSQAKRLGAAVKPQ